MFSPLSLWLSVCLSVCLSTGSLKNCSSIHYTILWNGWTLQCCFRGSSAYFRPNFNRTTLCVSALNAVARCPSVWLAGTFVHSVHTVEDIVKLLSRPGSPVILVFDPQRQYPIPRGILSALAQNTRRVGEFCDFHEPLTRFFKVTEFLKSNI